MRSVCSVKNCDRPMHGHGYCQPHLRKFNRHGDPLGGKTPAKHGDHNSVEWRAWKNMLARCQNSKSTMFKHYGARGISVCARWQAYANFLADMGRCPVGHTLERKDNDGNYVPDNCIWATRAQQSGNRRNVVKVTIDGVAMCRAEAARKLGIPSNTLKYRLDHGKDFHGN